MRFSKNFHVKINSETQA